MPRHPPPTRRDRECESCGWTSYPQPVRNDDGFTMTWAVPERCARCGGELLAPKPPFTPGRNRPWKEIVHPDGRLR